MEKKNESLGIYYLIILFLVLMIIIPPLFRYLMPANNTTKPNTTQNTTNNTNNNNTNITNNNTVTPTTPTSIANTLSCTLDEEYLAYSITTKYTNDKITDINFSYSLKKGQLPNDAKMNNMFTTINNLRTVKGASIQENTDKISVSFYLDGNPIQDELKPYSQEKNIQKASYEALGLKCTLD